MFLVTTANQNFWKLDEPILFLGEWCRMYSQKHVWSELPHEVLPYYGLDRDRVYSDYYYALEVYEFFLVELSRELNKLHGFDHTLHYWRIVIGPWLLFFIGVLLDRYRSICTAVDSGQVTNAWITPQFPEEYLANSFSEFRDNFQGDDYNHCLYSQLIRNFKEIPWETKTITGFSDFRSKKTLSSGENSFKWGVIRCIGTLSRLIPDSLQKVVAVKSYIKPIDLMKLQLAMKTFPCPYRPDIKITFVEPDWDMRREIKLGHANGHFESILQKSILFHLPKVYIEGYSLTRQQALEYFPKKPKVIITTTGYKQDEGFKFWVAGQVDQGVKLVFTQHGGHVGDGRWSVDDDHEIKIADRYFTWGWDRDGETKTTPMPSSMLGSMKDCTPDMKGKILCVTPSFMRYPDQMYSVPQGPLALETFKFQENFLKTVSSLVLNHIVFRLFPELGWEEKLRWPDSEVSPYIYRGNKSYHSHLKTSRLCVCFYNGTPFLEAFAANYPTLLCWDPKCTELNELAQPYFDLLRKAGILYDTYESAALKLNEIYQDPLSWWLSPDIQGTKNQFCDRFAMVSDDWLFEWKKELLALT